LVPLHFADDVTKIHVAAIEVNFSVKQPEIESVEMKWFIDEVLLSRKIIIYT
jgi:hypothetical protein